MAPTIRTLLAALLVALVMVVGGSRAVMANSISDQMKQMREQMQMRMDGIMQAQRERMQNLQMGSNPGANITVRSEVPLSVTTQMSSSSPNTQRSSVSSTSSGGTSTSSFQSVRTSTSSSFSSSSAGSGGASNGNATSSDRVALVIETPDAQLIFNVGPTLEKIGIKVDPLLDEKQAGGAEAEAEDEIPETSFTVKRVMIEDGADINKVGSSYPVLNLTIVSPIFNFTYKEAENGKSEYETCTLIKGKNASEISVIAPQAAVSSTFSPNMNVETQDDIMAAAVELFQSSPLGVKSPDDPLEASLHLSLLSSSTGKTSLVKAEKLFSLKVPPQWMESFASSQEGDIECSTKQCSMTDSSCLFEF